MPDIVIIVETHQDAIFIVGTGLSWCLLKSIEHKKSVSWFDLFYYVLTDQEIDLLKKQYIETTAQVNDNIKNTTVKPLILSLCMRWK